MRSASIIAPPQCKTAVSMAHARKKRRLDGELERMLETIEQRRINMGRMDERAGKARERDNKESEMVDLEKQVVGILVRAAA